MASLATTVSTQATALYTLLYSLMTSYAQSKFNSGVDMPYITITVNMADLSKTTEYAGYENLETVKLGDSVECIDNEHDISMTNRVIGLTYDVIRDYNSEVVLGNAAATVASIVGNANGQAVAGGFDTSAIESQLDSLQNKMGDFLVNGVSVVTNGVGVLNLQAGENISISRDGRTLTISGDGGGNNVYAGASVPNDTLGNEDDIYLQYSAKNDVINDTDITEYAEHLINFTRNDYNNFDFEIGGTTSPIETDMMYFDVIGLIDGVTYTVTFDAQFHNATFAYPDFPAHVVVVDTVTTEELGIVNFQRDNNRHSYSFEFTATNNPLIMQWHFGDIDFYTTFTFDVFELIINGEKFASKIDEIYGKINGKWAKYIGVRAGENIQINDGVISANDTTYNDFVGTDGLMDGASGLVPKPTSNDANKYLKSDGTWANVSGGGGASIDYSTSEQDTGIKWINGHTLYQKTLNFSGSYSGNVTVGNIGINNLDVIVEINGACRQTDGVYKALSFAHPTATNNYGIFINSSGDVSIRCGSTVGTFNLIILTLKYTKTTD